MSVDPQEVAKRDAARRSVAHVRDGMTLGLGSGTTARYVIEALGTAVASGMKVRGVPSSEETASLARAAGIPLTGLDAVDRIDLVIDGADEVDGARRMIKGRGGALLREKVLATSADRVLIVVDRSKLVTTLGGRPLPVEVVPFALPVVQHRLDRLRLGPALRMTGTAPYRTDQGNAILDCHTGPIADPEALAATLDGIVGVVEHGLFLGLSPEVIVGQETG